MAEDFALAAKNLTLCYTTMECVNYLHRFLSYAETSIFTLPSWMFKARDTSYNPPRDVFHTRPEMPRSDTLHAGVQP